MLDLLETQDLDLRIAIFIGDGHHDATGISRYLKAKAILPVIPLKDADAPAKGTAPPAETERFPANPQGLVPVLTAPTTP